MPNTYRRESSQGTRVPNITIIVGGLPHPGDTHPDVPGGGGPSGPAGSGTYGTGDPPMRRPIAEIMRKPQERKPKKSVGELVKAGVGGIDPMRGIDPDTGEKARR